MIEGMKVLGIITARGGSKRLPKKNILPFSGKPLIAWTIEKAQKSIYIDRLVVSSDDQEIIKISNNLSCDVPFIRPPHLSADTSTSAEVILHALEQLPNYDVIVLLQPTSPLRLTEDIDNCIEACIGNGLQSCVSLTEVDKSPLWMYNLKDDYIISPLIQDEKQSLRLKNTEKTYIVNGAVYAFGCEWFKKYQKFISESTKGIVMPLERSIDIDSKLDFYMAEKLMEFGESKCLQNNYL
jgi:CMP-N,N'-diacetyllegionaminic acid synthase